ncbi:transcriptional regulator [Vibrio sp. 10N.261.52.C2]|uniref:winged helix-turn-helix domain-containing protein n=1 Tax=Vibrio sp. 10N.261.52.C2 TaxID=3229681 RepID=UPI00354E13DE
MEDTLMEQRLIFDKSLFKVHISETSEDFTLSQSEYLILSRLEQVSDVCSKEDLIESGWGNPDRVGENSLPVAISNLRKVLNNSSMSIVNISRKGYILTGSGQADEKSKPPLNTSRNSMKKPVLISISGLAITIVSLIVLTEVYSNWVKVECSFINTSILCLTEGGEAIEFANMEVQ